MKVLLNSIAELTTNGYQIVEKADNSNPIISRLGANYNLLGKYSIETTGYERKLLIIKAFVISVLTLGLGLYSSEISANLKGRRIDIIYLKQEQNSSANSANNIGTGILISPQKPKETKVKNPFISQQCYKPNNEENSYQFRARIFQDTMAASVRGYQKNGCIIEVDNEPMLHETEVYDQIAPLGIPLKTYKTEFHASNKDTFQALIERKEAGANPVGINMANRYTPGGGVVQGCPAQEEALCRRSNHYLALKEKQYPLPEFGGIYSPHVKIFRNDEKEGYSFMDKPIEVALVATAAYDLRTSSHDRTQVGLPKFFAYMDEQELLACSKYAEGMKAKIRNMLRIMASKGHPQIVLGALGCGAFENPPKVVANFFAEIFNEPEFKGRFERVDFAILVVYQKDQNNLVEFDKVCKTLNL